MTEIREGGLDETGIGINRVDDALERVGIQLRDSQGQFRNLDSVILELSTKWDRLDRMEKANISTAIAGTRQRNIFLALMDNFNKKTEDGISVQQLLNEQMNSSGLAAERYEIYLESLEAAQNKMTVAWQEMWETTVRADWVKSFYEGSAAVLDLVTELGGLQTIVAAIIPLLITYKALQTEIIAQQAIGGASLWMKDAWTWIKNLVPALRVATVAQSGFNAAALMNPYVWVPLAVAGLILLSNAIPTPIERLKDLNSEFKETQEEIKQITNRAKEISDLASSFKSLKEASSTSQEFYDVQNKLKELMPDLIGYYDAYGNFIITDTRAMEKLTEATQAQIEAQEGLDKLKKDAEKTSQEGASLLSYLYKQTQSTGSKGYGRMTEADKKKAVEEYQEALQMEKERFQLLGKEAQDEYIKGLTELPDLQNIFVEYQKEIIEAQRRAAEIAKTEQILGEKGIASLPQPTSVDEGYKSLSETVKELNSEFSDLNNLMQKSIEGTLEFSDLENLPADYIDALEVENGKISLNISLLKEKQLEILKTKLAQVEAAEEAGTATQEEVELIKLQIEALEQQASLTHGVFQQTAWDNESLLWNLAKTAEQAGYSFQDAEGNALNSAQSIYEYMSMGNSEFNSFVEQLALKTGLSTQEIMNTINAMISQTASNASALVNYLGSTSLGVDSGFNRSPTAAPSISALNFKKLFPSSGASRGGGGGGGKSPEQIRLEKEKKAIENRKKALQDNLDEYKKYIEAQKESLRLQKEEKEFSDELLEKNKSLAKLKSEIAILALDDSEEAKAKRLKLEEDAANLETEIVKDAEDRKYELQMEALDKAQKDYEDKISAQIDLLDTKISKIEEESSAIGSLGGGYSSLGNTAQSVVQTQIMPALRGMENLTKAQITSVQDYINKWLSAGLTIEQVIKNAQNLVNSFEGDFPKTISPSPRSKEIKPYHDGGFVGDLKANETFAKLLDGEYVATEGQMKNFVKTILPRIVLSGQNSDLFSSNGIGKGLQINFNVAGNLDKTVVPKIEKMANEVVREINSAMKNRGFIRNTSLTSI